MKTKILALVIALTCSPTDKTLSLQSGGQLRIYCDGSNPIELHVTDVQNRYAAVRLTPEESADLALILQDAAAP